MGHLNININKCSSKSNAKNDRYSKSMSNLKDKKELSKNIPKMKNLFDIKGEAKFLKKQILLKEMRKAVSNPSNVRFFNS